MFPEGSSKASSDETTALLQPLPGDMENLLLSRELRDELRAWLGCDLKLIYALSTSAKLRELHHEIAMDWLNFLECTWYKDFMEWREKQWEEEVARYCRSPSSRSS